MYTKEASVLAHGRVYYAPTDELLESLAREYGRVRVTVRLRRSGSVVDVREYVWQGALVRV